jgi:Ca-activated chloride channel homolog
MKSHLILPGLAASLFFVVVAGTPAQEDESRIHVRVNLVQLNVAVTDRDGNYVTGLRSQDFSIVEDRIAQKIATFEDGNDTRLAPTTPSPIARSVPNEGEPTASSGVLEVAPSSFKDANVFVLFDTSNYMYRGFVYAQDAIAGFVRSLQEANKVAFYSYSRNLSRVALLTPDRGRVLQGVRSTVAGDDAALYNCLLLTVKDAARVTGRKVIVVFSNGPDNASVVPPEDVAELGQSTGTVIYMISTQEAAREPESTAVFERMSRATGGKAYFSKSWKDEAKAFASIRDDLAHLYAISYYPQPNPNHGWRSITVKLNGKDMQKYHIRTRDGYRLQQIKSVEEDVAHTLTSNAAK